MLLGSAPVLNAVHLIHEQTRPTAKIDGEPCFILDF
ncbi:hypothetical protein FP2_10960 [Faecalibacterium prausnitzii L2-6]|uniref:Uncharacterized protein n=1 Tax=Faecalibacterium prausnitzii L2-6 TaxID=718252 RepID=D4K549_9FIRM|nr:hypothetical protein FP2_10960 [Faecalibacterium prausnitzii L2-6]